MPAGPPPAMRHVVSPDTEGIRRSWHISLRGSGRAGDSVSPVNAFLKWWDGSELWLSGLPFVLQAMVVIPVVLAVAYLMAFVLDRLLGKGIELLHRDNRDHRAGGAPG